MKFVDDDGGRHLAGFKGTANDCVCRSIAIATGRWYGDIYSELHELKIGSPRNGIKTRSKRFKKYMASLGFEWIPTMKIGQGCTVHVAADELPSGRLVLSLSKHYTAFINGIVHDTFDPSRNGSRCVYGYWKLNKGNHSK